LRRSRIPPRTPAPSRAFLPELGPEEPGAPLPPEVALARSDGLRERGLSRSLCFVVRELRSGRRGSLIPRDGPMFGESAVSRSRGARRWWPRRRARFFEFADETRTARSHVSPPGPGACRKARLRVHGRGERQRLASKFEFLQIPAGTKWQEVPRTGLFLVKKGGVEIRRQVVSWKIGPTSSSARSVDWAPAPRPRPPEIPRFFASIETVDGAHGRAPAPEVC
jgi:hypothetical protein